MAPLDYASRLCSMTPTHWSLRLSAGPRTHRRVDADDPRRLVAEHLVRVRDSRGRDDYVAGVAVAALALDRPAHPAGANRDDVILRRVVDVHLLDLPDRMRD